MLTREYFHLGFSKIILLRTSALLSQEGKIALAEKLMPSKKLPLTSESIKYMIRVQLGALTCR